MTSPVYIIIPARLRSTRFPKKILAEIKGKTLMEHTYAQAVSSKLGEVILAVDDLSVEKMAAAFGANKICMTSVDHISGTSRLSEVCQKLALDPEAIILNWQVDEPLLSTNNAAQVISNLKNNPEAQVATLCEKMGNLDELKNPNVVKVVRNRKSYALYFSRAMIPWDRAGFTELNQNKLDLSSSGAYFRHLGLYAYRVKFLLDLAEDQTNTCQIENLEGLEQLRFLDLGYRIHVDIARAYSMPGIDMPEDLLKLASVIN